MDVSKAEELPWWAASLRDAICLVDSSPSGLSTIEAKTRRRRFGANRLHAEDRSQIGFLLWRQVSSPIVLILIAAAALSFLMHDATDGVIILFIVTTSSLLGFWQEYRATTAVASLQKLVSVRADVLRDGTPCQLAMDDVVPGDVVLVSAGSSIPADCRVLEAHDLFVDEATLTGESFPVEKMPGDLPANTPLAARRNALFQGTHVVSGLGRAMVIHTGRSTEFGAIAERLRLRPVETEFEHGVRQFGMLLIRSTLVLVIVIFGLNVYLQRPVLDSFLFALALAVGLTPELLPAIISVNLATGARRMAERQVIVKRLVSIENFGSMNVLCSDKTGTLTAGKVRLDAALDTDGQPSEEVRQWATINATFQTGFANPIDAAIVEAGGAITQGTVRLDEIPYDFARKRLSILAEKDSSAVLVTKGALLQVLEVCTLVQGRDGTALPIADFLPSIHKRYEEFSSRGLRTLGLATKPLPEHSRIHRDDEADMTFIGFLLFGDPPQTGITRTLAELRELGVTLKIITGDNLLVAQAVAERVGLLSPNVVTGESLRQVSDDALPQLASTADLFAEIEPNQKERIIRSLRKAGHVVGYMGDGINDAPALHAADVGLSVQGAADVAKEAADIVLLTPDLAVLAEGVREGRRTFANTQKYVFMATSANFGNMFSMAGASLLLPFLPLLPKQILLTNLLTDLPEMTIATDRVDTDAVQHPQRWDILFIRRFMFRFGLLSSLFDYLTFALLYFLLAASPALFRSGWFVESVVSACLVVLVVRSRKPFWRSRPSQALGLATLAVIGAVLALPYTQIGTLFGFVPLPLEFVAAMALIVASYVAAAEALKRSFYRAAGP